MKTTLTLLLLATVLSSCNSSQKQNAENVTSKDPLQDTLMKTDTIQSIPSKAIELKSSWDSINLHKISRESDTISFNSSDFKEVEAVINSEKAGNIRFNQIILPDNNSDGPFGKDIKYQLDKKGDYKLIIGESLMQGDPFDGNYILKFKGK